MPLHFAQKPSLIVYLTCGDPDLETTKEVALAAMDAGAAVIELGVPFSDPVADGPVIQRASERALRSGTTLGKVLEAGAWLRKRRPEAGLIVFSYLNPILRLGWRQFCARAEEAGVDGTVVVDLPIEESQEYTAEMRLHGLRPVFLAAPTSTDERLKKIARASGGFVYAVSRTGVTGARQELPADARELVRRLRRHTQLPIAVGFGISTQEQFRAAGEFADAVVVGSAVVALIESAGREDAAREVGRFVAELVRSRQPSGISRQAAGRARAEG